MRAGRHLTAVLVAALLIPAAEADARLRLNRSMEGVALGMSPAMVADRLGAPASRTRGPDFVTWSYRRPPVEVTLKPGVITLRTASRLVRGPGGIGVGTSERRLRRVIGARLRCSGSEAQRLCMVGSFATGRRSTVFDIAGRRVSAVTISLSTP